MALLDQQLQRWLPTGLKQFLDRLANSDEAAEQPEENCADLTPEQIEQLSEAIQSLPNHPVNPEAIYSDIKAELEQWQASPQSSNNSLAILSSPGVAIANILAHDLEPQLDGHKPPVLVLATADRARESNQIESLLEQRIQEIGADQEQCIVVIPDLSQCFLRSVDGLSSLDFLQETLLQNPCRFTIMGLDPVTWHYLGVVSHLATYCSQELSLPKLEADQLQDWLKPVIDQFQLQFSRDSALQKATNDSPEDRYFKTLAALSNGNRIVAEQLFLQSIHPVDADHLETLELGIPELPSLPSLEESDNYLLYSLLLHGEMTLSALADSLGETLPTLRYQAQALQQSEVILQREDRLSINPLYDPKLRQSLALNNFVIDSRD
ncbi:MAG: ArsR family transcriptional regulator [Cyanobacteria bacterium P01_A01_bin.17]